MQLRPLGGYYWDAPQFANQELREAHALLEEHTAPQAQLNEAFLVLLNSEDVVAQGIVFDLYFYTHTQGRWGVNNPYEAYSAQLVAAARHQLRQPPVASGHTIGTNYASALGVLVHEGTAEDIPLIEPILRTTRDVNVLEACLFALGSACIPDSDAFPQTFVETMVQVIEDEEIPMQMRQEAVGAWRNARWLPPEIEHLCLHLAQHASPLDSRLPMEAAWTLGCTNLAKHRAFLEHMLASWPPDVRYPASEVRELLEDDEAQGSGN
jgi:hypothetical protein